MNRRAVLATVGFFVLGLSVNVRAGGSGGGERLVLNLIGTGAMYEDTVPDIDGDSVDDPAICFDINVVNAKNRRLVGTGTDCLANITPMGTGLALVGTTYFHLPNGTLVTRGNTTVQPVLHPTVTPDGQTITHITGASSDGNSILSGTRRFSRKTGTVRLSGMVDMINFGGNVGDPITFDCLFVFDLDRP